MNVYRIEHHRHGTLNLFAESKLDAFKKAKSLWGARTLGELIKHSEIKKCRPQAMERQSGGKKKQSIIV